MIKVKYIQEDDKYTYLSIKGHAEFEDSGKDLVCAGASSIVFGLMNALDDLSDDDVVIKDLGNEIVIENRSKSEVIQNYFELVIFQLKTIEESYGEYLKVERK